MANNGWIKIHRKILDTKGYHQEPFCRNMAWIDLLLLANHEPNFFRFRGIRIDVKRGETGYGIETFCLRWKWSRGKVERFLKELEKDKMIVRHKNNRTTLISILKYNEYQTDSKADKKANDKADKKANDKANDKANGNKQE